ncbi:MULTISPECIES: DNA primase DnaG [Haloprofundus]|uniref:DNA primase DnaG n=1 Tax=Haloprofundus TaxID=1911573 RepID=UPI000E435AE2|nr:MULTISPECIES: DNA primase DnaG [Haloprofundus]QCJ46237.1 DNA primase [Haloprofundus sp. MHR1]
MEDTAKYLIHASVTADGVVERSDVVGAVFGQTEGLLGDDLDLRDLQQGSKIGRIDVEIDSENGQSFGRITIASSLDKVETAILAAALESITRVGPCQAHAEVVDIEDVRSAKRREVVDRAKELLSEAFDDSVMTSREILEEVRESVRVEDITEYHGLPAGPRVADSDAIVVVEGRADILTLLRYGIKNGVAVEGTNVPDSVAELTENRTVTAFLDGDRGGELILRELAQVGNVDYVAFAPPGRSVEDLARHEVMSALRDKVPYDAVAGDNDVRSTVAATDGSSTPAPEPPSDPRTESPEATDAPATPSPAVGETADEPTAEDPADGTEPRRDETTNGEEGGAGSVDTELDSDAGDGAEASADASQSSLPPEPKSLREHVVEVIDESSGLVRLLDADLDLLTEGEQSTAFDALVDADLVPYAVVVDGELDQRLLDVAAQRGVDHVVARSTGEFVKKPVDVRIRTAAQLQRANT